MKKDFLEVLTGDKTRANLFNVFFRHKNEQFTLKKLKVNGGPQKVKKIVEELLKEGILKKYKSKKSKEMSYKLNPQSRYFNILDSFIEQADPFGSKAIANKVSKLAGLKLILFTDKTRPNNPEVDLLIVGTGAHSKTANLLLVDHLKEAEALLDRGIEYVYITPNEMMHRVNINDKYIRDIIDNAGLVLLNKLNHDF